MPRPRGFDEDRSCVISGVRRDICHMSENGVWL